MTGNPATADDLAAREARLAAREAELAHRDNLAFAEGLVAQDKLIPALAPRVVALLDHLAAGSGADQIEFAEGATNVKERPADAVKALLSAMPKVVETGASDLGDPPTDAAPAFAAPDGLAVDPAGLELHGRALAYQAAHPGTDYLAAVRAAGLAK